MNRIGSDVPKYMKNSNRAVTSSSTRTETIPVSDGSFPYLDKLYPDIKNETPNLTLIQILTLSTTLITWRCITSTTKCIITPLAIMPLGIPLHFTLAVVGVPPLL